MHVMRHLAVAFGVLYLRRPGFRPASSRHWQHVEAILRMADTTCPRDLARALAVHGLLDEAHLIVDESARDLIDQIECAGALLTPFHSDYPQLWHQRLGAEAPPALWRSGLLPEGRLGVSFTGCRDASQWAVNAARRLARETQAIRATVGGLGSSTISISRRSAEHSSRDAIQDGSAPAGNLQIISGGARGVDEAASLPGSIQILPWYQEIPGMTTLSLNPPGMPVSKVHFHERNLLIYALAHLACVIEAHHLTGGSWTGALTAFRRKLCPLAVYPHDGAKGNETLLALGAIPLISIKQAMEMAATGAGYAGGQRPLFDATG